MKNLLSIIAVLAVATALWFYLHSRCQSLQAEQAALKQTLDELRARTDQATSARRAAEDRLTNLRPQVAANRSAALQSTASELAQASDNEQPDPAHQGGWPAGADFFYLPKDYLTSVSYPLLQDGQVTDEAAVLLGLAPAERSSVNQAVTNLLGQFRQVETQRLQKVAPPADWTGTGSDSNVTYRIPSLSNEILTLRQSFAQQLRTILGDTRLDLFQQAADSFLREQLDDRGATERTVGFLWKPESDGSHSLWYGVKDAGQAGTLERVPDQVDPGSPIAYYANLFGVKLPNQ